MTWAPSSCCALCPRFETCPEKEAQMCCAECKYFSDCPGPLTSDENGAQTEDGEPGAGQ